ncbi:MAG: hypothetical protein E6K80_04490 [Candidatus Eisenbacteria bacterium]|uniref:Uncharacterized protein n=1 Tax=Eiseniibacteriota bacterium TaxID=2212470 RepID=A0A538U7E0_UNCEI|nr:MAG: hypothetical protein E6K80_04490 [Candidatus Eisenbacteria bacterium]
MAVVSGTCDHGRPPAKLRWTPPPVPVATYTVSGFDGCSAMSRTSVFTRPRLSVLQVLPPLSDLYTPFPNVPA